MAFKSTEALVESEALSGGVATLAPEPEPPPHAVNKPMKKMTAQRLISRIYLMSLRLTPCGASVGKKASPKKSFMRPPVCNTKSEDWTATGVLAVVI